MIAEKKLAIYVGEREEKPAKRDEDIAFHTFLMLIDETQRPVEILQQLHFNDLYDPRADKYTVLPNARLGMSHERALDGVRAYPLIGGCEYDVMEMWNYALNYASYTKILELEFSNDGYTTDPKATNCTAGMLAVLRALDIEFDTMLLTSQAGAECDKMPDTATKKFNNLAPRTRTLNDLWKVNEGLRAVLDADWIPRLRYVGPIKRAFIPMDETVKIECSAFE